ncbi:hypothetical protein PGT21_020037 [Puccinia graminis f. sp. tritici]|nr:hypothetical protein PGT21_020037 [Puccinia graminis f. sp. tritici]
MGSRTVATPLHTAESSGFTEPSMTRGRLTIDEVNDDDELPTDPTDVDQTLGTSDAGLGIPMEEDVPDRTAVGALSSPAPAPAGGTSSKKRKLSKNDADPLGLQKIMQDANVYRRDCINARKARESEKNATEKKRIKLEASRDQRAAKLESRRIRVIEIEAQMKIKKFESEEIRNQISYMKELKELGHSKKEISRFFEAQYNLGKERSGSKKQSKGDKSVKEKATDADDVLGLVSESGSDSDSDSSDDVHSSEESSNSSDSN